MKLGSPIAIGTTSKIYLYDNKIVKVFNDLLPDTVSTCEANKQSYAYSYGLSVPKILDVKKIDEKQAIIMEYIKGRTLGEILSKNLEQAEYYMNNSVEIQQQIHKVPSPLLELMSDKLIRQINSARSLEKRHKAALIQKLNTITFEKRLCHGDFHLFNLIISDDDKVIILDWIDSSAGDVRADVYRSYLLYSQHSIDLADMYLHLYCEKSGLTKEEVFQWAAIIAGARLSENVTLEETERLLDIVNHYCPL